MEALEEMHKNSEHSFIQGDNSGGENLPLTWAVGNYSSCPLTGLLELSQRKVFSVKNCHPVLKINCDN